MEDDARLTVSVEEAGALLGISRAFASELAARVELPCVLGRRLLVPRKALDALLVVDRRASSA